MVRLGLVVACALAVCVLTAAEFRRIDWLRWWGKSAASTSFLALAAVGLGTRGGVPDAALALGVGLAFGAVGDVLLLGRRRNWFRAGALSFLVGNVAYLVAFAHLVPPAGWIDWTSALPITVTCATLWRMWRSIEQERVVVVVYCVPLTLLAVSATALAVHGVEPALGAAGLAFYVSDLLVARNRFVRASVPLQAVGRAIYYAAQLTFAAAIGVL